MRGEYLTDAIDPVIHMADGSTRLVDENDLPLTLPEMEDFKPTGTGEPPLAKAGACVIVIDHLSKGSDSRTFGAGGTAAKKRAVGGVSLRVRVKDAFTPGKGGSAYLSINKDRHGGLREHCPSGDREPLAGVFELKVFEDGVLEPVIHAAKDGQSAPTDFGISGADPQKIAEDVATLDALDPPPTSQRDVCGRLSWGGNRAADALRAWRDSRRE